MLPCISMVRRRFSFYEKEAWFARFSDEVAVIDVKPTLRSERTMKYEAWPNLIE